MTSEKMNAQQLLLPVFLISFVVAVFLGFQTTVLISDHTSLEQAHTQQDKPLEQATKIKAQVNALAVGTLKLAKEGNKNAQNIIDQLKKAGVNVGDQPQDQTSKASTAVPTKP